MFLKIGQRPDHGFDEPLGLLSDCHRRIEHFLSVLVSISARSAGGHLDARSGEQLEGALHYFATAAPRHTADEEESLFPRLDAATDAEASKATETARRLESDHLAARELHATADRLGQQWLQADMLTARDARSLHEALERLAALYTTHIAVEDQQLFPAAARILSADDVRDIGREMACRRMARSPTALTEKEGVCVECSSEQPA